MVVIVGDGYGWTMGLNIFCALPGRLFFMKYCQNLGFHLSTSPIRSLSFPLSPCSGRTIRKLVIFATCYLVMMDLSIRLLD